MPPINKPPIGLTDQEILCVIAYLQTLGGTPTVTLQTTHKYLGGDRAGRAGRAAAPAARPARRADEKGASEPVRCPPHRRAMRRARRVTGSGDGASR